MMPPATSSMMLSAVTVLLSLAFVLYMADPAYVDLIDSIFNLTPKTVSDYTAQARETVLVLAASSYALCTAAFVVLPNFLHAAHLSILSSAYVIRFFAMIVVVGLSYMPEFFRLNLFYSTAPVVKHIVYVLFDSCVYALLFSTPVVIFGCARLMPEPVDQQDTKDDLINTPLPRPVMRRKPIPTLEASRKRNLEQRLQATSNTNHRKPRTIQAQCMIQPRTLDDGATTASALAACVAASVPAEPQHTESTIDTSSTETETETEEEAQSTLAPGEPEADAPFMAVLTPPDSSDLPSTPTPTLPAPVTLSISLATPISDWTSEGLTNNESTPVDSSLDPTFDDTANTQTLAEAYSNLVAAGMDSSCVLSKDELALAIQVAVDAAIATSPAFLDSPIQAPVSNLSAPLPQAPAPTLAAENTGAIAEGDVPNANTQYSASLFSHHAPFTLDLNILPRGVNAPIESLVVDNLETGVRADAEQRHSGVCTIDSFTMEFLATPGMPAFIKETITDLHNTTKNDLIDPSLWNDPQFAATLVFTFTNDHATLEVPESTHYPGLATTSNVYEQFAMELVSDQAPIEGYVEELLGRADTNADLTMELHATPDMAAFVEAALFDMNAEIHTGAVDPSIWDDPSSTFGSGPSNPGNFTTLFRTYKDTRYQQPVTLNAISGFSETESVSLLQQDLPGLDGIWASLGINATTPSESDDGLNLDLMLTYSGPLETGAPSPHTDASTMPADLATIEEMLDLCLALDVSLESTAFSADVKMDQLSSALAGSAYDTTTSALEDATTTINFATTAEPMSGATKDVQLDQLFEASQQDPSAATHAYNHPASYSSGPPLQTEATPMDSDMSMTDEQCLAQLSELCHGMTIPDSLDPSFDLSTVLDSLLSELSALSPASPSNSLESQSETQSTLIGLATLGSNSGRLRIQDWVDPSFIFDSAAMDESEADLDSPATPDSVPMDVDKSLKTEGYWSTGVCEQETVCPLDTLLANSQICRPISRF